MVYAIQTQVSPANLFMVQAVVHLPQLAEPVPQQGTSLLTYTNVYPATWQTKQSTLTTEVWSLLRETNGLPRCGICTRTVPSVLILRSHVLHSRPYHQYSLHHSWILSKRRFVLHTFNCHGECWNWETWRTQWFRISLRLHRGDPANEYLLCPNQCRSDGQTDVQRSAWAHFPCTLS